MKKILLYTLTTVILSSCATIFLPKKQKVTFTTAHNESIVYVEKEEVGKGKLFKSKIKKEGFAKQIIVKTPGYKDTYAVLPPSRRQIGYWFLQVPNPMWLVIYGFYIDAWFTPKNVGYQRMIDIPADDKFVYKGQTDKYVDISAIKLNIKNKDKDIQTYYVDYSATHLADNIKEAERKQNEKNAKEEMRKMKKKNKSKNKLTEPEDTEIKYDDTKFSYNVYKTLKNTGFVDTVNKFFSDANNTIYLEGSITKLNFYNIYAKRGNFSRSKLFLTWYIKNNFNEILDSVVTSEFSGDFTVGSGYSYSIYSSASDIARIKENYLDEVAKMYGDAIDISYLKLHKNPTFTKYLKTESDFKIKDQLLTLSNPKSPITDKTDAGIASVIVKTNEGHGSGFAITQDGYIVTNYHVVAGKINNKLNTVTIINSNGDEIPGTIVRYNKFRDLALIKVNKTFDKAFKITNVKSFKNLQDVMTIGAPKSVELGQSVSTGVISNERKSNNNNLIQLNMGINSGNSGGPLFDATGTLHGVIVSKAIGKNTEGISFAIPGYMIQEYLNINYK
jgi:S1-C subfamily serine protease